MVSEGPVGGLLRFNLPSIGQTVVEPRPSTSDTIFPVRRRQGGLNTGVAIHDVESTPELVRCELMREGVLQDAVSLPLAANAQTSWLIDGVFTTADRGYVSGVFAKALNRKRATVSPKKN